tara:strand:+ start:433 stop:621 length:189 start_codon:yes stop_codon:yes gene_type:complete
MINNMNKKYNYMFDVAGEIETSKDFDEITVREFCEAIRKRLDRVESNNDIEAFGLCDSYEAE